MVFVKERLKNGLILVLLLMLAVSLAGYAEGKLIKRYVLTINPQNTMGGDNIHPHKIRFIANSSCLSDNKALSLHKQLDGYPVDGSDGRFIGYEVQVDQPCQGVIQVKNDAVAKSAYVVKGWFKANYQSMTVMLCKHHKVFPWDDLLQGKKINDRVTMRISMNVDKDQCFSKEPRT